MYTDEYLQSMRQEGDPVADRIAQLVLGPSATGMHRKETFQKYNQLLESIDQFIQNPEHLFESPLGGNEEDFPKEMIDFFRPVACPDWVDESKLSIASDIWQNNMITCILVLYSASLPHCYIIEKGVPVLYNTGKLGKMENLFQRVYETGLMLDHVMEPGGIKVINDSFNNPEESKKKVDGDELGDTDAGKSLKKRFLWGKGIVQTKKVRILHSVVRFFVLDRGKKARSVVKKKCDDQELHTEPQIQYNSSRSGVDQTREKIIAKGSMIDSKEEFRSEMAFGKVSQTCQKIETKSSANATHHRQGFHRASKCVAQESYQEAGSKPINLSKSDCPINQLEMAFTLLTFGYAIPKGLENWGCKLSLKQKESFLHTWKVVGYIIGIREDMLTDNWEEAGRIFNRIKNLEGGPTKEGVALTTVLCKFFESYFPESINTALAGILIKDQMGEDIAHWLLDDEHLIASKRLFPRCIWWTFKQGLWVYLRIRDLIFFKSSLIKGFMGNVFHQAGKMLYNSWKEPFETQPFSVPLHLKETWKREKGIDDHFVERLKAWRPKVFYTILAGMVCLFLFAFMIPLGLAGWLVEGNIILSVCSLIGVVSLFSSFFLLKVVLKWVVLSKPKPSIPFSRTKASDESKV